MSKPQRESDERRLTSWKRVDDPFQGIKPLENITVLAGGLPDDRDPDDILRDLRNNSASL